MLMAVDNGTSTGNYPSQGDPHPIGMFLSASAGLTSAWYIESPTSAEPLMQGATKAGRSFYTSLGHLDSSMSVLNKFRRGLMNSMAR